MNELFFPSGTNVAMALMLGGFASAAVTAATAAAFFMGATKRRYIVAGFAFLALAAASVVAIVVGNNLSVEKMAENEVIRDNRAAFFEDRGIFIPSAQLKDLGFPEYEPEEADARYGIAQAEYQGKIITIRLARENGEMVVYGTDGLPLERID